MAKKSTPTEKAARMLDLVPYISSHQGIATSELAEQFGIPVEELLSDLNSLWMCGDNRFDLIDLEFESGFVSIRNAQTLNVIRSLTQQEIVALLIGLDLIENDLDEDRDDLKVDLKNLRSKLGLGLSRIVDATPSHDGAIASTIEKALKDRRKLQITYFSPTDDEISTREITPLQFTRSHNRDFLIAFCESAQGQRTFRLDRIQEANLLAAPAGEIGSLANQSASLEAAISILSDVRKSREALGTFISGDGAEVRVSAFSQSWLSRTVISAAGAMQVTASPEMREYVAASARKTLDLYR